MSDKLQAHLETRQLKDLFGNSLIRPIMVIGSDRRILLMNKHAAAIATAAGPNNPQFCYEASHDRNSLRDCTKHQ
jgi:hypothetical protein